MAAFFAAALALYFAGAALAAEGLALAGDNSLTVTDLLVGQAKAGPYALSWNHIGAATVSVSLNGFSLLRGVDYTVDEAAGTVTFAKPVAPSDLARVTYLRRPGVSQVNAVSLALPIAESARGPLGSTLGASYLYQRTPDHAGTLTHGFVGALQTGAGSRLSGALLLNDPAAKQFGTAGPRKRGWSLAGEQRAGRLALTGSLARAEQGLVGGKEQGLEAGVESLNLGATYQAARGLTAGATLARRSDLAADSDTRAIGYSLAYQPDRAPSLGLAHTTTTKDDGRSSLLEEKNDYTFLYKSPVGVTVDASLTDLSRDRGADESTAKYALAYSGRDGLSLGAARVSQSREDAAGDARTVTDRLSLKTRLGPRSVVTAAQEIQRTDQGGASATSLDLTTAFMRGVDLRARYLNSGIAPAPSEANRTPQAVSEAAVKVTAIPLTQLSGRIGKERFADTATDLMGVDAVMTPSRALSLGGGYTRRSRDTGILDTRTANLTLAAGDALKLSGEYAENPTDDAGQPLLAARSKVNLTTQIGSVSLGGGAGRQTDVAGVESALYEAQVGLRLGRHRVYTGYRLSNSFAPDLRKDDQVYRLGYSHDAGPNFSLSLEAQLLLYRESEHLLADRTERRAQASLNARF